MARILVVDDDQSMRNMLRDSLEQAGYAVEEASDGQEGIDKYLQQPADIVDMMISNRSGLEVLLELKRDFSDAKIIAISGFGIREEPDMVSLARRYGASYAFEKPFDLQELLEAVEALLGRD